MNIKNFKCLDNYSAKEIEPLNFKDLNILVGENDSGKSSLLETIRIFFGLIRIRESMFREKGLEVIIQASLNKIDGFLFDSCFKFQSWNISYYKFFNQISSNLHYCLEDNEYKDWKIDDVDLIKQLDLLDDFDFSIKLKDFFKFYAENAVINIEEIFKLVKSSKNSKYASDPEEEMEIIELEKPIELEINAFFDLDFRSKSFANTLLDNDTFKDFIISYLKKFDSKCNYIANEMIKEGNRFNFSEESLFSVFAQRKEGSNPYNFSAMVDFIKDCYCLNIFNSDSKDDVLSKLAYVISIIINNRSIEKAKWFNEKHITIDYHKDKKYLTKSLSLFEDELNNYKGGYVNLFGNVIAVKGNENSYVKTLPKPEVHIFDQEVNKETVSESLYDIYRPFNKLKSEIFHHIRHNLNIAYQMIEDTTQDWFNGFLEKVKDNLNFLNEEVDSIKGKIRIKEFEKIMDYIEPVIEVYIDKNLEDKKSGIVFTEKGQGFIRKTLLASFLASIEESGLEKDEELPYKAGKILLLEEPELHLHPGAQRNLMKFLKEKLGNANSQVFFTTHSIVILEEAGFDNYYVFKKNSRTKITRIDDFKDKEKVKMFEAIQLSLGLKKGELLSLVNLIVFVEGERDQFILEALCERPDINYNLNKTRIHPVKGQSKMRFYVNTDLANKMLDLKILAILDENSDNYSNKNIIIKECEFNLKEEDIIIIKKIDLLNYLDIETVKKVWKLTNDFTYNENTEKLENILEKKRGKENFEEKIREVIKITPREKIHPFLEDLLIEIDKRQSS